MSDFDFGKAVAPEEGVEVYHPPTVDALPSGNYIVKITEIENAQSSGGYPMLKLTLENEVGRQWDNLVISPAEFSVSKLLGLLDSAKVPRPDPEKGEIDRENGRLSDAFVYMLRGRTVGVIVRDEEDNRDDHRGEFRPRVKGYVDPGILTATNTGPMFGDRSASNASAAPANSQRGEAKLAF